MRLRTLRALGERPARAVAITEPRESYGDWRDRVPSYREVVERRWARQFGKSSSSHGWTVAKINNYASNYPGESFSTQVQTYAHADIRFIVNGEPIDLGSAEIFYKPGRKR